MVTFKVNAETMDNVTDVPHNNNVIDEDDCNAWLLIS